MIRQFQSNSCSKAFLSDRLMIWHIHRQTPMLIMFFLQNSKKNNNLLPKLLKSTAKERIHDVGCSLKIFNVHSILQQWRASPPNRVPFSSCLCWRFQVNVRVRSHGGLPGCEASPKLKGRRTWGASAKTSPAHLVTITERRHIGENWDYQNKPADNL